MIEHLTPDTKINLKWIIDANVKHKGIKPVEENIGKSYCDLGLEMMPKAQSITKKINKLDFIKIKTFTLPKTLSRELRDKLQTRRKYLQPTYLTKD